MTIVSYAKTVGHCLQAADTLAQHGIDAEVIDLRTLKPLDTATLLRSVRKTGRAMRRARGERRSAASAPRSRPSSPRMRSTR